MGSLCKWKSCKKILKDTSGDSVLLRCSNASKCDHQIHQACLSNLLSTFGADKSFKGVVCGKRCFNATLKALKAAEDPVPAVKKRVAWHNDGPAPSISSVSCLIDWMTTGSNYARYRGGDAHSGETKSVIAGEIVSFIEAYGVTTTRTAKDVQTKILALEQSYKTAADWLNATGQGVEDEKCLRDAILSRCAYYYDLQEIMDDRDSTNPLMLNTDIGGSGESDNDEEAEYESATNEHSELEREEIVVSRSDPSAVLAGSDLAIEETGKVTGMTTEGESTLEEAERTSNTDGVTTSKSGTCNATLKPRAIGGKRSSSTPRSIGSVGKKMKETMDELSASYPLAEMKRQQLLQEKEFQLQTLKLKREKAEATASEIQARIVEAAARTQHFQAQALSCELGRKVNLLRERHKLRKEGVPLDEIDALLPLGVPDFE